MAPAALNRERRVSTLFRPADQSTVGCVTTRQGGEKKKEKRKRTNGTRPFFAWRRRKPKFSKCHCQSKTRHCHPPNSHRSSSNHSKSIPTIPPTAATIVGNPSVSPPRNILPLRMGLQQSHHIRPGKTQNLGVLRRPLCRPSRQL